MSQKYKTFTEGRLLKALEKKWPNGFWRSGNEWDGRKKGNTVWAGAEDSDVTWGKNGLPLFNYWVEDYEEHHYTFGVHNKFRQWLEDRGWWSEWNDPGTIFFYKN